MRIGDAGADDRTRDRDSHSDAALGRRPMLKGANGEDSDPVKPLCRRLGEKAPRLFGDGAGQYGVAFPSSSAHAWRTRHCEDMAYQTPRPGCRDGDRPGPTRRGATNFHGKAGDLKSVAWQYLEVVQFL